MKNSRLSRTFLFGMRISMACVLALGVVACGDAADDSAADQAAATETHAAKTYDASLLESPCDVVSKEFLADMFGVPADELDLTPIHVMGASCSADWNDDNNALSVEIRLKVFDNTEQAAARFKNSTRSMSKEEISAAVEALKGRKKGGSTSDADSGETAESSILAFMSRPIIFEDVEDVGDEARFGTSDGKLVVRIGNLIAHVSAYYGALMELPDDTSIKSMMKARAAWSKKVMPVRKQQTIDVAREIVASL